MEHTKHQDTITIDYDVPIKMDNDIAPSTGIGIDTTATNLDDIFDKVTDVENLVNNFQENIKLKDEIINDKNETIDSLNGAHKRLSDDLILSKTKIHELESDITIMKHELMYVSNQYDTIKKDYVIIDLELTRCRYKLSLYKGTIPILMTVVIMQLIIIISLVWYRGGLNL